MPTPIPIIAAAWVAKLGIVNRLAVSSTRAIPHPMPNSATRIGRPIASSEPKAMSRMTMAASRPTLSLENVGGSPRS